MYVNFTLKRFGHAVKATSSGTIDNEHHGKNGNRVVKKKIDIYDQSDIIMISYRIERHLNGG